MAAEDALPHYEGEARKRQIEAGKHGKEGGRGNKKARAESSAKELFACECGECFDLEVWHCPVCAHHWPFERKECWNCHEAKAPSRKTLIPKMGEGFRRAVDDASRDFRVSSGYISDMKAIKERAPDIAAEVRAGKMNIPKAKQELSRRTREVKRNQSAKGAPTDKRIIVGDFREKADAIPDGSLSLIFTDPPYDRVAGSKISGAKLPETYTNAKTAIEKCSRLDECKDWADKAEAIASYAKQAGDNSLRQCADRIQARAMQRCGDLLKEIPEGKGSNQNIRGNVSPNVLTRKDAARDAGLSVDQRKTALRVASVPKGKFEELVESDDPPTVTRLAEMGIRQAQGKKK